MKTDIMNEEDSPDQPDVNKSNFSGLKKHLVDSTALMVVSTPLFSAIETYGAKMPFEDSYHSRLLAIGLTYGGLGRVYTKGLDTSRKLFKINDQTREKVKQLHDAIYSSAYTMAISPPFYLAAGVRDIKQIAIGTAASMGFGLIMGGPAGYAVDAFRDLSGIEESKRLPKKLKKQPSKIKKTIAAIVIGSAIGLTAGVYKTKSILEQNKNPSRQLQNHSQTLENKL